MGDRYVAASQCSRFFWMPVWRYPTTSCMFRADSRRQGMSCSQVHNEAVVCRLEAVDELGQVTACDPANNSRLCFQLLHPRAPPRSNLWTGKVRRQMSLRRCLRLASLAIAVLRPAAGLGPDSATAIGWLVHPLKDVGSRPSIATTRRRLEWRRSVEADRDRRCSPNVQRSSRAGIGRSPCQGT
jgi:hypothetical protein